MDQARCVGKIYYGYAQAAKRLGAPVTIYRSSSAIDPISADNIPDPGVILASFTVNWKYNKFQNYGVSVYTGVFDGRLTQPQDFLVDANDVPYFIGSQENVLPILVVRCNVYITIKRPYGDPDAGLQGYSGRVSSTDAVKYQNIPASMLLKTTKGVNNNVGLPTDTRQPLYTCLLPYLGDVQILTGDLAFADWTQGGRPLNLVVWQAELTELGWRMQLEELGA